MKFSKPLIEGKLVKRYKRFMADIILEDGNQITAHCANTGAMIGIKDPGMRVWVSESDNPERKLKYSWEIVEADNTLVGCHTAHPNTLVEEAIRAGVLTQLQGYESLRREVKYGNNSRIDILLENPDGNKCYVEVKNVHLMRQSGLAEFPDSVTTRGAKHMAELADMVKEGHRAAIVYLVQRADCDRFQIAGDLDPEYLQAANAAFAGGVEVFIYGCTVTPDEIKVDTCLKFDK